MRKIIRYKKPSLDDYDEGYHDIIQSESPSAGELVDVIENLMENRPDGDSRRWRTLTNYLIDKMNNLYGPIYNKVK